MTTRPRLTQLELLTLAACARLGRDAAYGVRIRREIVARARIDVTLGAVYKAVHRLQQRGCVSVSVGESTAVRGGRAKKHVEVEPQGLAVLAESLEEANRSVAAMNQMVADVDLGSVS